MRCMVLKENIKEKMLKIMYDPFPFLVLYHSLNLRSLQKVKLMIIMETKLTKYRHEIAPIDSSIIKLNVFNEFHKR